LGLSGVKNLARIFDQPHRRFNALTGEWVFVSPQRTKRPWHGEVERVSSTPRPEYDPACYLCPGNARANGLHNPPYTSIHVFTNDYPAFLAEAPQQDPEEHPLLRACARAGTCKVICFSPRHDLTLAQMSIAQIAPVIDAWAQQVTELGARWRWVQLFENQGEAMGCSNPHPHGQIWAGDFIPNEPAKELAQQRAWLQQHDAPLLLDYAAVEVAAQERVVVATAHWLAVVPWWAVWPFEILILPRRHVLRLPDLTSEERADLAELLSHLLQRYDKLFETSFPYSFGWHGAPTDDGDYRDWQLHAHIYPPLLSSATVKKFMVGYELLSEPQRDLTPEQAAERLQNVG
jgi:UDPglucose--hexose-1-phosphate uridylyltransferase